jgi:flagellar hook-associated protein 1 FlgK
MGASPLMNLGLRAMTASYAAMQTTGHNIANANVAGYSRQQVELATATGQFTGAGFFGKGVDVKTISRTHDEFLTHEAATAKSLASMDAARQVRLKQLEQVFPAGEGGIGYSAGQLLNSMVDLASRPGDTSTRQVVLARAEDMAARFRSASSQLDSIQAGVTEDLKATITTVNGIARSIAQVNQQIAAAAGTGQPPNDLLDQRDQLINKLSEHLQVSTVAAGDGTVGVFIAGGQQLVLGGNASSLRATLDPNDPSRVAFGLDEGSSVRIIDESILGGGSLAGLLRFQNSDLVDARNQLGQMATGIAGAVNRQQLLGVNLYPAGTVPTGALFELGSPQAIPASSNVKDASGGYASSVSITITEPTAVRANDYSLRPDLSTPGSYILTRLSVPPVNTTIVSGDVVDGMRIDIGTPAPAATDRFLLQPVGQAAGTLRRLLQDPRDLAAASPLYATLGTANTGSASVASLTMLTAPPQPNATAQITFTSDTGDYNWQLLDSSAAVLASGTGTWTGGGTIPTAPDDINGFSLKLAGVPRSGDVISVQPTLPAYVPANNGNATALSALRDAMLVGRTQASDGTLSGGATATDAYASAMADVGVRVQGGQASSDISSALANQAEQARASESGVNLDEEAARLIQYQQSYQAAAKVLQIAQQIFQTLLDTAAA